MGFDPRASAIPAMRVTPELIPHLLAGLRHLSPYIVMLYCLLLNPPILLLILSVTMTLEGEYQIIFPDNWFVFTEACRGEYTLN